MTIAVPLNNELILYHDNPFTAPKFAIYFINGDKTSISFKRTKIVDNPRCLFECNPFDNYQIKGECDIASKNDIKHICEHYAILESIGNCSYLLADRYCKNTSHTLKNGGISVFKIPTIINTIDMAIKYFLIGASFANKIQNIHNVS